MKAINIQNKIPRVSIIIPTCINFENLLKPCIESILKYTHMEDVEVVISANGCKEEVRKYIQSLGEDFKLVWADEPLGYVKAVNEGIKAATGEFFILLNDDTRILEQPKNTWIDIMLEPFHDERVGIVGPLMFRTVFWDENRTNTDEFMLQRVFMSFWCVAIRKKVIDEVGMLDEIFSPGYGEDIDFCFRVEDKGYIMKKISGLPVEHLDGQTFSNLPHMKEYLKEQEAKRGTWGDIIKKRYIKNHEVYTNWRGWITDN